MRPQCAALSSARRHFQHGPIDLVIGADGAPDAVAAAHASAWVRFETILAELVGELAALRRAIDVGAACPLRGPVARRMWRACAPHAAGFITPMAAVAGAVADDLLQGYRRPGIARAWVNNGGDVAIHLTPGTALAAGLVSDLGRADPAATAPRLDGRIALTAERRVRGIATSGWRGRSFSFGIADSVTVLAATAAAADAAATVIANAVDVADARIVRAPASSLKDDTDLGDRPVTVDVPPLPAATVEIALARGAACAIALRARGLIDSALLVCQQRVRAIGPLQARAAEPVGSVFAT